ncbi:hypothetical protein T07_13674 [Trichinella nelsoni]|uniref:Uncharacterized protein n=1 Tax=Trichinella nelsoni TaxID=6336 RepID=A0A0V0RHD0_9BILA|nr:hypothetical protein T07_5891 [Trichinella nelsoni]KRX13883.1 hypothetical protein T07_13674 [Trichinella nelsoni]
MSQTQIITTARSHENPRDALSDKSSQDKDTLDHCLEDHQVGNLVTHVWVRAGPCGAWDLVVYDHKGEQQLMVAPPGGGDAIKTPSAWRARGEQKEQSLGASAAVQIRLASR